MNKQITISYNNQPNNALMLPLEYRSISFGKLVCTNPEDIIYSIEISSPNKPSITYMRGNYFNTTVFYPNGNENSIVSVDFIQLQKIELFFKVIFRVTLPKQEEIDFLNNLSVNITASFT